MGVNQQSLTKPSQYVQPCESGLQAVLPEIRIERVG